METFSGGFFIKRENFTKSEFELNNILKVTLNDHKSLKETIIDMIRNAEKNIKLCSFIISDAEIYSELIEILKTKNIAVFIITQLDNTKLSASMKIEELSDNFYQKHIDYVSQLYTYGAHVRAAISAHAKFILVDNKKGLIMSSNITEPSLNTNPESGIEIQEIESIENFNKLFDIIYQHGTEYTKFKTASKDKQFIVSRNIDLKTQWIENLSDSRLKFTWGENLKSLYEEIIHQISSATFDSQILISTYSVVGLDLIPEFVSSVQQFISNGGKIILFCRGMNYRPDHLMNCQILSKLGVEIYGDNFNHSKGIISGGLGLIFTANIDGHHGLTNGFEVGYVIEKEHVKSLESFILWQIENAPYRFEINPSRNSFYKTYDFYTLSKKISQPELPEKIIIFTPFDSIEQEFEKHPIYVYLDKDKKVRSISIGNSYFTVHFENNTIEILEKTNRVIGKESYLLKLKECKIHIK